MYKISAACAVLKKGKYITLMAAWQDIPQHPQRMMEYITAALDGCE